jgi:thiol-disulfide isomerase/thioredoxin
MRRLVISTLLMIGIAGSIFAGDVSSGLRSLGMQVPDEKVEIVDFELADLKGETVSLSSFHGKVVFLNFWATWCGPCRSEMPSMEKLHQAFSEDGLEIVAVNLMEGEKAVQRFMDDNKLTFTVLLDSNGRVGSMYGARAIPTTYIIDRDGYILAGMAGSRDWYSPEAIALFKELLAD